jgi:glycosyltransferase involved in cell wall biosynthesis
VAVYNEDIRLAECLASLLAQTYSPLGIIVVDDGSTDRTRDVARRFPSIKLLAQSHQGKAKAVNRAAAQATGAVLLFLDGDMYFDSRYVELLLKPMIEDGAIGSCHAAELVANPDNVWSLCWQARAGLPPDRRVVLSPQQIEEGSPIYRAVWREDFIRVGGFDDTGHTDDHTLFPKLGRRAVFVPEAICHHYNVEDLAEVFSQGVWGGKSIYHQWGARALLRYFPAWALIRAGITAWRMRRVAILPYDLVADCGIFWGVLRRVLRIDTTYAR